MRKWLRRILNIAAGGALLAILLPIAATFVVNSRSFQEKLLRRATSMLSEKLQTRVSIDSASVSVFRGSVELYGLEVDDQQKRPMFRLDRLTGDVSLPALFEKRIDIKEVAIKGVDAHLFKPSREEPANYQFVIDAFKGDSTKTTSKPEGQQKTRQKLSLNLEEATLEDIHVSYNTYNIDLESAEYRMRRRGIINLNIAGVASKWTSQSKRGPVDNQAAIGRLTASFDDHLKSIDIQQLRFATNNNKPRKNAGKPKRGFFDAQHLDITADLHIIVDSVGKDTLVARLERCQAVDSVSGIDLRQVKANICANKNKVHLRNITVQQKSTILRVGESELILPNKQQGRRLSYSTGTITGTAYLRDISRTFAPVLKKFSLPLNLSLNMRGTDSTITFRNIHVSTNDKKLDIRAIGDIKHLKEKEKLDIQFNVSRMTAKGDIKEKIINQFTVKKLMMKQLRNLGDISYTGKFFVRYKRESFQGVLGTQAGSLNFNFMIDNKNKYLTGQARSQAFDLGKVMDMKDIGNLDVSADFKIDISKPRTALMRRKLGGHLPIGSVAAVVEDCSYKKIHVRHIKANIESNGAVATGDIFQHGNYRDLSCSFSFTNTDDMRKIKISNPGIKFHKISDEDRKTKAERREQRKQEKELRKQEKKQQKQEKKQRKLEEKRQKQENSQQEPKKKKKFLFF